MQEGQLLMTQAERDRRVTLKKLKKKLITHNAAAEELGLSVRQTSPFAKLPAGLFVAVAKDRKRRPVADAITYTQTTCSTGAMPIPQSSVASTMDKPCSPTWQAFTPTQPHKPGNKN